ncbi:shikimate kinase [Pedobacter gandavensis]|uniref:Shikimate kinase n=1 Tax=Pedobacter gandavensis TaxID=2679963 RepID=A0ABR6F3I8_9SPHI|nr:shikimate kinase [Pedobacter gandavensis]MBB2151812.1 AAA family ATPase [Pedobacter gandavensis]
MKIFLIGFMGCGKSTLGRKLATKLGYDFIDLDHQIEMLAGMPIGEFFAAKGEPAFRVFESKTLKEFNYPDNCVVATGGGAPCYFDNMQWINENGLSVYIEMPPTALAKRLEGGKDKRPLLKDMNEDELIAFIAAKLEERNPFYQQANQIVNGISLTPDALRVLVLSDV